MAVPKRIARVSKETLYRDLKGEGILLQLETGQYYGLDDVGHRMWQLILELGDLDRVQEKLLAEYDVDPKKLGADLDRFTALLAEKKLIEIENAPSGA